MVSSNRLAAPRSGARAAAAILGVVALGAGTWAGWRAQAAADQRETAADQRVVAAASVGLAVDLGLVVAGAGEAARQAPGTGSEVAVAVAQGSLPAGADLTFVPGVDPDAAGSVPASPDAAAAALHRARDSGDTVLLAEPGARGAAVVAPSYGVGPSAPVGAPERRARLLGWVVVELDLPALVQAHLPAGTVGQALGGHLEATTSGLGRQVVDVAGGAVTVVAGRPGSAGLDPAAVAAAAAGVLAAGLVAAGVLEADRRIRAARAAADRSAKQVELIGEVAPLVQQSLDLGEVLPGVAVLLTDHFDLAGVRLSTGSPDEGFVEQFTLGRRPPREPVTPQLRPPEHLGAGEVAALALQRGGRSVALLELVAGVDLHAAELQSLGVITELITATVVNASLYADQQLAVRRLRDLDALKTVFLSTASHELRTPATAIGGFASLLSASWDRFSEEQRRDFAERIAANARSLNGVVQDLLDFSLLDQGEAPPALTAVDLGSIAEEVVDRLGPVLSGHQVVVERTEVTPVLGEVNGLERVITNLLTNAVKFSPPGSTVRVQVGPVSGGAAVSVCDEGPGVPPEERELIFTRFYRGAGEAVIQTRGVGIGLSVVQQLVTRMGGTAAVDEAPGGGARFTVRLPAATSDHDDQEDHHAATS